MNGPQWSLFQTPLNNVDDERKTKYLETRAGARSRTHGRAADPG